MALKSPQKKKTRAPGRDLKIAIRQLQKEIPTFKHCKQCGECCGPLLITTPEYVRIIKELSRTDQFQQVAQNLLRTDSTETGEDRNTCPLLNITKGDPNTIKGRKTECMVYRKRPIICRAQAVTPGMPCEFDKREYKTKRNMKLWKRYGELAAADRVELRPAIKEYINMRVIQHDIKTGEIETVHIKARKADEEEPNGTETEEGQS